MGYQSSHADLIQYYEPRACAPSVCHKKDYTKTNFERIETFANTQDSRDVPSYRLAEAARYLRISTATLRSLDVDPRASPANMSFANLVIAHIAVGIRRKNPAAHLERVLWGKDGKPSQFFPFTRRRRAGGPKPVVLDPALAFGRPVLAGTGIAIEVIASRFKAGESVFALAEDYDLGPSEVEEAIRWELWAT